MTIRLLCAYDKYPTNAIVTLDAGTEAGLIAANQASASLAGGTVAYVPVQPIRQAEALLGGGSASIKSLEAVTIKVPEGQTITLTGAVSTAGMVQHLDATGATLQSWSVSSGVQPLIGPYSGAQRFLVSCLSGSIDVVVGAAVLGAAQISQDAAPVVISPAGVRYPIGGKVQRQQTLLFGGDSISTYQDTNGWSFTGLSAVTGVQLRGTNQAFPSGAHTLAWDATAQTLTLDSGTPVAVTDGRYTLYAPNGTDYLKVGVTTRNLAVTNQSDTITTSTLLCRRNVGSIAYAVDAFTNRRFQVLPDMGISGNTAADMVANNANRISQIAALIPDVYVNIIGTNDQLNPPTPTQIAANIKSIWGGVTAAGAAVIQLMVMPRNGALVWGGAAGTDSGAAAATYEPKIVETNRQIALNAAQLSQSAVSVLDVHTPLVDVLTGKMRDFVSEDGLHPSGATVMTVASMITQILDRRSPDTRAITNVNLYSAYNASTCPGGNLMNNNRGAMVGSGGTLGTGAALTPVWAATTAYAKDAHVIVGDRLYRAMIGGTSGSVRPQHTTGNALDGTVLWQFVRSNVWVLAWTATLTYNLEDIVVTTDGKKYQCTVAGTTSSTKPTTVGSAVVDGTVTWKFLESGCSMGLAANWSLQRQVGSAVTVTAHRVKSQDSGSDWQELVVQGSAVDPRLATSEEISFYPGAAPFTFANLAAGDLIDMAVQLQILEGSGCAGVYMDALYTGLTITHDNNCLKNCANGFTWDQPFRLALNQVAWVGNSNSVITAMFPRIRFQAQLAKVFYGRVRDMDMRKIVA